MTALVAVQKGTRCVKHQTWIVSCFTDPVDIITYDAKTMSRLTKLFYKKSRSKIKKITIDEILNIKRLGESNFTLHDKKGADSSTV